MSTPERLVSQTLAPAAVPVPETQAARRTAVGARAWLVTAFLFLLPVVTYWPATFHEYGLRDDYSNLRESHEEIGKILQFCASHARPIYGWLLQSTYGQTSSVHNLEWTRLFASFLLGSLSLVMYRGLRALGWPSGSSLCVAALVSWLPSSQVIAGWAVGWPYAAAALTAAAAFFAVEGARSTRPAGNARFARQWTLGAGLLAVSALIYQPSALFYVVPMAGALIARRERGLTATARWALAHVVLIFTSLGFAYCTMTALYSAGVFVKSARIAFEHDWSGKIAWFLSEPLPNALSLFVLNDDHHRDRALYLGCAAAAALILAAGACLEWKRHGRERGMVWTAGLLGLPLLAFSVSLLAAERYATYRTALALTAVLVCFLVVSLRALTERWNPANLRLLTALALTVAFVMARHHVNALIAVPQGNEWQLILQGARHVHLTPADKPRVFAIASGPADISTATIYHDEFGSLSSNSEWVPKEMFKRAMHDLHPEIANIDARYEFAEGYKLPAGQHYDLIIDMRRLRQFYTDD